MLVRCPKCETGFNLPPAKVPEKGAKLRCSACTHTFRVKVSDAGQPLYVDKKGRPKQVDGDRTQLGGPLSAVETSLEEQSNQTQLGVGARSKSARQGYNPFPLAGGGGSEDEPDQEQIVEESAGDSTQLFGGAPSAAEFDDPHDIALFDEDDLLFEEEEEEVPRGDQTILGPQARAPDRNGRQATGRAETPAKSDDSDEMRHGNSTQAFGSGGLDLFEGQKDQATAPPPLPAGESDDISSEAGFDPFEDAFDHPVDADIGLLMPSTPSSDDIEYQPLDNTLGADSSSDVGGMSEEQFLMGGPRSDFGPADELVDPEFGAGAAFDPNDGVVGKADRPKDSTRGQVSKQGAELPPEELELVDVRTDEISRKNGRSGAQQRAQKPAQRSRRPANSTASEPRRAVERPPPKIGYVDGAGATSPLRRAFELAFISLVVVVAFAMFTSARAGWFFDFARVGHMLEVAFGSTEFVPREEWQQIVEVEPAEPPPDEPLRLRNVRAFQVTAGETPLLVVTGKVRNYSLKTFSNVSTRARVLDADGEVLSEQTEIAGRDVDMSKLANATTAEQATKAIETKLPDIGKEGSISVAFIFDDLDTAVLESGEFDYDVAITD